MNPFPLLAALTLGVGFAVMRAGDGESVETPLVITAAKDVLRDDDHGRSRGAIRDFLMARTLRRMATKPAAMDGADEGLLDHELLSDDPINAWLERYLTPASR